MKLLGFVVVLCSVAAACSSSDTTATAPVPVADPGTSQAPNAPTTTATTPPEPEADPDTASESGAVPPDTATTVTEPAADSDTSEPDTDAPATATVPEPAADSDTNEPDTDASATTTASEPAADPDTSQDPDAPTTTATVPESPADSDTNEPDTDAPEPAAIDEPAEAAEAKGPSEADTPAEPTDPDEPADSGETDEVAEPEPTDSDEADPTPDPDETAETGNTQQPTDSDETDPTPDPDETDPAETDQAAGPDEPDEPAEPLDPVADRLPADPDAPAAGWVAGINAAGWDFHRHLTGNAVSSPISIGMAFSLSRAGASADSGAALDDIFGFPENSLHSAANAVDLSLAEASVEPNTLEVANRLFPDDGFSPGPEFLNTAAAHYGAAVQPIDTADGAAAANIVNRWVSERTRGLIPTIVDAGVVQDQKLVLVNTVYLKADWAVPFLPELTEDDHFNTGDDQSVTVPFMRDRVPVERRYVRLDHADAVELPYEGGELAMWLIVPRDPAGLAAVEESLDAAALAALSRDSRRGTVQLAMPKWEQTLPPADLFGWLCPQGFCPGAAFERIAPGIFMSAALHGAKVIVDEKGTEAAAATAMAFPTSLPPPPDLKIIADRPFLWAIVHQSTGAVVFVGRLINPAA